MMKAIRQVGFISKRRQAVVPVSPVRRTVTLMTAVTLLMAVTAGVACAQGPVGGEPSGEVERLELKSRWFRSTKFVYGEQGGGVFDFTGLSFDPDFEYVMSAHPEALQEAERSKPYNLVALGGSVIMLVSSFVLLNRSYSNLDSPREQSYGGPIAGIIGGALVSLVSSRLAWHHVHRGVHIFNEKEAAGGSRPEQPGRPESEPGSEPLTSSADRFRLGSPLRCLRGPVFCVGWAPAGGGNE